MSDDAGDNRSSKHLTEKQRMALIKRAVEKARKRRREVPLNPDRDLSWDSTDFGDYSDD